MRAERQRSIQEVVQAIPRGQVSTYGAVARRLGRCNPRQVGQAMAALPDDSGVPWHRVLNHRGAISIPGESGVRQRRLLEQEGVVFDARGRVDLAKFGWGSR